MRSCLPIYNRMVSNLTIQTLFSKPKRICPQSMIPTPTSFINDFIQPQTIFFICKEGERNLRNNGYICVSPKLIKTKKWDTADYFASY